MCLRALYHVPLVVEGGGGTVSFHGSNARDTPDIGTQKETTEHVTVKERDKQPKMCTDSTPPPL